MKMGAGEEQYRSLVAVAENDPAVVGLILTGSRGRNAFVRPDSDWDVRLVVADGALADVVDNWSTPHGSPVEVVVFRLRTFVAEAEIGTTTEWDRYSYVHCQVVIDKLDGAVTQLVADKSVLPPAKAPTIATNALGTYINSYYRAMKNAAGGLDAEAHLDAAESVGPLLTWLFAIHGRVRPFNKFLGWELRHFPLPGERLAHDALLPRLRSIVATAAADEQASLFRDVETIARSNRLGSVIDSWGPDVERLRRGS